MTDGVCLTMRRPKTFVAVFAIAIGMGGLDGAHGEVMHASEAYNVVSPPACTNNHGEVVSFVDSTRGRPSIAVGMARRDSEGKPIVVRSNFAVVPEVFQSFIDRHECAHHQTGDVDRPHPPRNGPEHLMNESISDCVAIIRLRDEEGYDTEQLEAIAAVLRGQMTKIGFPEISISSRTKNIENCFLRHGSPQDFIDGILTKRGLLQP